MQSTSTRVKPDLGQTVVVEGHDGETVSGMVVDALSSQFTFIPFGEKDIRRVRFCFYNEAWK